MKQVSVWHKLWLDYTPSPNVMNVAKFVEQCHVKALTRIHVYENVSNILALPCLLYMYVVMDCYTTKTYSYTDL